MPRSFADEPRQSATDIAAALMTEGVAPDTAAQERPNLEETPEVQPQPERGNRRDATGRFAPREEVPTAPETPDEPSAEEPGEPEVDYRAEAERQRQENERLRRTYENNTRQQREALETARREAEELRQSQRSERERLLQEARDEVAAIPDHDPRKVRAELQLASIEREEAQRIRREVEEERQGQVQAQQQQATTQADLAARVGSWGVVEAYAAVRSKELGLPDEEAREALEALKTPELAILFQTMEPQKLVQHVRNVVGHRLHEDLDRRAQARRSRATQETERNRQEAVASGAHGHARMPAPSTATRPAYVAYTRENKGVRLGRKAAADAIFNGILDE